MQNMALGSTVAMTGKTALAIGRRAGECDCEERGRHYVPGCGQREEGTISETSERFIEGSRDSGGALASERVLVADLRGPWKGGIGVTEGS